MARNRTLVRASDLSSWAYCGRAWWLANVQGEAHQEPDRLTYGAVAHLRHGRSVVRARRLQQLALVMLALAALLAFAALAWR